MLRTTHPTHSSIALTKHRNPASLVSGHHDSEKRFALLGRFILPYLIEAPRMSASVIECPDLSA